MSTLAHMQHRRLAFERLDERTLLSADAALLPLDIPTLQVSVEAPSVVVRGEPATFSISVTGSEGDDILYIIDWENDGEYDETHLYKPPQWTVTEEFWYTGVATPHIWVADYSTGQIAEVDLVVDVKTWRLAPNETVPDRTDLIVGGTIHDDFILLFPGSAFDPSTSPDVVAFTNSADPLGLVAVSGVTGGIVVYGQDGQDTIIADLTLSGLPALVQPVTLYGGPADDLLIGSPNADVLDGGHHNDIILGSLSASNAGDLLIGDRGRDILIGGAGADVIVGGGEEDLLIAGFYNPATPLWGLFSVRYVWSINFTSFAERTEDLLTPYNGEHVLLAGTTVIDDDAVDIVLGDEERDWYFVDTDEDLISEFAETFDLQTEL